MTDEQRPWTWHEVRELLDALAPQHDSIAAALDRQTTAIEKQTAVIERQSQLLAAVAGAITAQVEQRELARAWNDGWADAQETIARRGSRQVEGRRR